MLALLKNFMEFIGALPGLKPMEQGEVENMLL